MNKTVRLVYERFNEDGSPLSNNYHLNFNNETNIVPHFYQRLPSVELYSADNLPDDVFLYELNWDYNRKSQQEFFDLTLLQGNIRESIITRIREKTAFILLTVLHEGWMDDVFLNLIHQNFSKAGIPLSQVIYVSNCFNGDQIYNDYCKKYNVVPEIKNEYCPTFRIDRCDVESIIEENNEYILGEREKTFLCFNRRYSEHRLIFYMLMQKHGLIDQFYLSMSNTQPGASYDFLTVASNLTKSYPEFNITDEDVIKSNSCLPLVLDNPDFGSYPMEQNPVGVQKYYEKSLINIVSETYFINKVIHITEKTYKPIAFMQPFIMIAAPYSLRHVKDLGFKTFDEFWDETYDNETNNIIRMNKIVELVRSISNWSNEKKIEFEGQVKSILEYNREHLRTIKNNEMEIFLEKYGTK
jgi:hypothetical protein